MGNGASNEVTVNPSNNDGTSSPAIVKYFGSERLYYVLYLVCKCTNKFGWPLTQESKLNINIPYVKLLPACKNVAIIIRVSIY